jgi:hypothetical protein
VSAACLGAGAGTEARQARAGEPAGPRRRAVQVGSGERRPPPPLAHPLPAESLRREYVALLPSTALEPTPTMRAQLELAEASTA